MSFVRSHLRDAELKPGEAKAELAAVAAAGEQLARSDSGVLIRGHVLPLGSRAETGGINAGTLSSGGALIDAGRVTLAEALQPTLQLERLGARRLDARAGDRLVSAPADVAAGWVGEDGEISASGALFGAALLEPREAAVRVRLSRNLLRQAGKLAETELRLLLQRSIASHIEEGILDGTGANAELLGMANDPQLQRTTFSSSTALPTRERLAEIVGELVEDGADLDAVAVLASAADYADSQAGAAPLVEHTADGQRRAAGVPIAFSPYLPTGRLIVADWSRLVIAYIAPPQMIIDPFTNGDQGIVNMTLFQSVSYATERRELLTVATKEA